ncbi:nuclear transcription factor Y subunit A-1-like isoform X1 [Gastrolobium bilobum]|uniref:nuclear transcription factor Y subunit A-1-like isoform X1 n=2 Tax=Gastrolobium bilobum TaxID=150636 RepID=UPI002AAF5CDD|nr:nuclear transcription factor Y subunit A-1-like isoform X1 [Gastrolobium bilobum]
MVVQPTVRLHVLGSEDMQSKSETANRLRSDPHSFQPSNVYSEPWWRGIGYNPMAQAMSGANASHSSSLECPNGDSESNEEGQSLANSGLNEEDDDATKDSQPAAPNQSGNDGLEHQGMQRTSSSAPSMREECLTQTPQLELVGHSIACATNPYQDPYYGGMMAAYGHQQLGYAPFIGMPQARMPLPLEMTQEPVYVNAKQYQGILRRRQARAKAELERKLIKARKPYLHESRHQHAMRRARGTGGRFAKKSDTEASNNSGKEKDHGSGPVLSSQSISSSGSEPLPSDTAETWNSPNMQQDARGSKAHDRFEAPNYENDRGSYHGHNGMQSSMYTSGERVEEGDCSGQQRGSISSKHASHRRVTIQ